MLDLANSLKALKAFKGLLSFPDLGPRRDGPPLWYQGDSSFDITIGLMLGDLSAVKRYPNSMAVLKFCHLGPRGARRAQGRGVARATWPRASLFFLPITYSKEMKVVLTLEGIS
jgi:hypothetical protein